MNSQNTRDLPIACDPAAIAAEAREIHLSAAEQLLRHVAIEVQELADGLAFRYAAEHYGQVTQFIANERLCCPFFTFTLEVTPAHGPIWLHITGGVDVKEFLKSELTAP